MCKPPLYLDKNGLQISIKVPVLSINFRITLFCVKSKINACYLLNPLVYLSFVDKV